MRNIKPLAKFRVYPEKSTLYFLVYVWNTKKDLLDKREEYGLPRLENCQACVVTLDVFRNGKKQPLVGEVHFHRKRLGMEIITHETYHMTINMLRRYKADFSILTNNHNKQSSKQEEVMASVGGIFGKDIVNRLTDLGFYGG